MTDIPGGPRWSNLPTEISLRILEHVLDTYHGRTLSAKAMMAIQNQLTLVCSAWAIELRKVALHTLSIESAKDFHTVLKYVQWDLDGTLPLPFASLVQELDIVSMSRSDLDTLVEEYGDKVIFNPPSKEIVALTHSLSCTVQLAALLHGFKNLSALKSDVPTVVQAFLTPALKANSRRPPPITTWEVDIHPSDDNSDYKNCVHILDCLPTLHNLIIDFSWFSDSDGMCSGIAAHAPARCAGVKALRIRDSSITRDSLVVLRFLGAFPLLQHLSISRSVIDPAALAPSVHRLSTSLTELDLEHGLPGGDPITTPVDFVPILRLALPNLRILSLTSKQIAPACLQTLAIAAGFPMLTTLTIGSFDRGGPPYGDLRTLLGRGRLSSLEEITILFRAVVEGHDEEWARLRSSYPSIKLHHDLKSHIMRWNPAYAMYHCDTESYTTFCPLK